MHLLVHNASAPDCYPPGYLKLSGQKLVAEQGKIFAVITVGTVNIGIFGFPQELSDAHGRANVQLARRFAETGRYRWVTIDKSWPYATGEGVGRGKRPDIIAVRNNDQQTVDAYEIESPSDAPYDLVDKLRSGFASIAGSRHGESLVYRLVGVLKNYQAVTEMIRRGDAKWEPTTNASEEYTYTKDGMTVRSTGRKLVFLKPLDASVFAYYNPLS